MTSDHFPIEACINFDYSVIPKTQPKKLNYKKANWLLFREILKGQNSGLNSASFDELNEEITQKLISAAHKSIPYQTNRIFKTSLPPNIVKLMKKRLPSLVNFSKKLLILNNDLINPQKYREIIDYNLEFFNKENQCKFDEPVSTKEITSAIKRLKEEASSGPDQIHNL
ncbi:hypothetical protein BpHYR1_048605, partial [Brachionus plicatilis]